MSTDIDAIKDFLSQWVAAINDGRANAVVKLVSDDVVLRHPPAVSFAGKRTMARLYQAAFRAFDVQEQLQYEEIRIMGGFATARVTEHLMLRPKDGSAVVELTERDAMYFRRQSDRNWKLAIRSLKAPSPLLSPFARVEASRGARVSRTPRQSQSTPNVAASMLPAGQRASWYQCVGRLYMSAFPSGLR